MGAPSRPTPIAGKAVEAVADWCRTNDIRLAVAFGSRARGTERPDSDLDLAVWAETAPSPERRLAWHGELERAVGAEVQLVVVTSRFDPVLGMQIAREGVVVYADESADWTGERVRLWHLYQDSLPFLAASRRLLRKFTEQAGIGS